MTSHMTSQNQKMRQGDQFHPNLFLVFIKALCETKASGVQLSFSIFRQPSTQHTMKPNYIKLQTIHLDVCSILIFYKRVWKQFLYHILSMNFQKNCFSYSFLINQISLSDCLYFIRYCAVCVSQLFISLPGRDSINFEINLIFLTKPFFYMTKISRQKFKYLENCTLKEKFTFH